MRRSYGRFFASNDAFIEHFIKDERYKIYPDGTILTIITQSGKISTKAIWREAGSDKRRLGYKHVRYMGQKLAVHRIIYAKFIGKLNPELVVNHIDENGLNNSVDNLELISPTANTKYTNDRLTPDQAKDIKTSVESAAILAARYNISEGHVSSIRTGRRWSCLR